LRARSATSLTVVPVPVVPVTVVPVTVVPVTVVPVTVVPVTVVPVTRQTDSRRAAEAPRAGPGVAGCGLRPPARGRARGAADVFMLIGLSAELRES